MHRSNFFMDGFVESPLTEDIAALARQKRVPFVEDLGSGAMVETADGRGSRARADAGRGASSRRGSRLLQRRQAARRSAGRHHRRPPKAGRRAQARAAVPRAALRQADSVGARSDGGRLSARRCRRFRSSRCCTSTNDDLRGRAERIIAALDGLPLVRARVGTGRAQIGGGTLPRSAMPSVTLDLTHRTLKPQEMAARLREQPIPVIGYIARGTLKLDLRTIFPRQDAGRGRAHSAPCRRR